MQELKNRKEFLIQQLKELKNRKEFLIQQLKELNKEKEDKKLSEDDYIHKKKEAERKLIEIMDRLTQLAYLLK
ncbi:MAG: hypothetical protein ACFFD2_05570 [Promethearchaeota archaeon]